MSNAPKRAANVIIRIGLRRLCANLCVRDRSIEILRFGEASNWAPLSGDLRGTMMLEKCCAVPGKNLPDTEKWLCSYCLVWRGLASMAQPVRPAAQALQQVEALTGLAVSWQIPRYGRNLPLRCFPSGTDRALIRHRAIVWFVARRHPGREQNG
jgi:hypothetical protein